MKTFLRIAAVLLAFCVLLGALYLDSNYRLVTEEITVVSDRLPEEGDGLRVALITDLHGEWSDALYSGIVEVRPDIICVVGDIVDGISGNLETERDYVAFAIGNLCRVAPVYYVTGNHEWASDGAKELIAEVRNAGAVVLRNEYLEYRGMILAGCDDPNGPRDQKSPRELVSEIREAEGDRYVMMLYHRNDRFDMWVDEGVDLVLCGHAHGGLIRLPFTDGIYGPGRVLFPKYTSGLYTEGRTAQVVSRGVGGPKLRLFNNPDVVMITLKKG